MPKKSKKKIHPVKCRFAAISPKAKLFNRVKVAFQGEIGAFSEEAVFKFFGSNSNIQTIPCQTFADVFKLVEEGNADFGILPIENSLEGTVGQNYELLLTSDVNIFGEEILRIRHCLIANKGVKIGAIKRVYSHPQALGQCREFLEKLKLEAIPVYDTAGGVRMLKEEKAEEAAAIASERAGKIYQMKILKKGIETNKQNFTRFFIISLFIPLLQKGRDKNLKKETKRAKDSKTSIVFSLKNIPGILFQSLEGFAKRKINLTKIESRPIMGKPWEYHFYLDFEGHQEDKKIREALEELKEKTLFIKILGSYPTAKWR
ncbi:prephenate dehydratase [Patescibacteria group bacterium]|nr:prephenate dehydratase [Patescibacteria group bacterium]MBU4481115.1 prephenate dehydratase [Patescibacteria group bacterium]